jgi:hypothetical protein
MRRWVRIALAGVVAVIALLAAVSAATVVPLLRDDASLDGIVVAVALDWRDFGQESAQERLQYELDHQEIGAHVGDEDCALSLEEGNIRQVSCAWSVDVQLPVWTEPVPMHFESLARVDPNGVLSR